MGVLVEGVTDLCRVCGCKIVFRAEAWRHSPLLGSDFHPAEPTNWQRVTRECKFNCRGEGPPGPIWCRDCGHDPKCCNCEVEYAYSPKDSGSKATDTERRTTEV